MSAPRGRGPLDIIRAGRTQPTRNIVTSFTPRPPLRAPLSTPARPSSSVPRPPLTPTPAPSSAASGVSGVSNVSKPWKPWDGLVRGINNLKTSLGPTKFYMLVGAVVAGSVGAGVMIYYAVKLKEDSDKKAATEAERKRQDELKKATENAKGEGWSQYAESQQKCGALQQLDANGKCQCASGAVRLQTSASTANTSTEVSLKCITTKECTDNPNLTIAGGRCVSKTENYQRTTELPTRSATSTGTNVSSRNPTESECRLISLDAKFISQVVPGQLSKDCVCGSGLYLKFDATKRGSAAQYYCSACPSQSTAVYVKGTNNWRAECVPNRDVNLSKLICNNETAPAKLETVPTENREFPSYEWKCTCPDSQYYVTGQGCVPKCPATASYRATPGTPLGYTCDCNAAQISSTQAVYGYFKNSENSTHPNKITFVCETRAIDPAMMCYYKLKADPANSFAQLVDTTLCDKCQANKQVLCGNRCFWETDENGMAAGWNASKYTCNLNADGRSGTKQLFCAQADDMLPLGKRLTNNTAAPLQFTCFPANNRNPPTGYKYCFDSDLPADVSTDQVGPGRNYPQFRSTIPRGAAPSTNSVWDPCAGTDGQWRQIVCTDLQVPTSCANATMGCIDKYFDLGMRYCTGTTDRIHPGICGPNSGDTINTRIRLTSSNSCHTVPVGSQAITACTNTVSGVLVTFTTTNVPGTSGITTISSVANVKSVKEISINLLDGTNVVQPYSQFVSAAHPSNRLSCPSLPSFGIQPPCFSNRASSAESQGAQAVGRCVCAFPNKIRMQPGQRTPTCQSTTFGTASWDMTDAQCPDGEQGIFYWVNNKGPANGPPVMAFRGCESDANYQRYFCPSLQKAMRGDPSLPDDPMMDWCTGTMKQSTPAPPPTPAPTPTPTPAPASTGTETCTSMYMLTSTLSTTTNVCVDPFFTADYRAQNFVYIDSTGAHNVVDTTSSPWKLKTSPNAIDAFNGLVLQTAVDSNTGIVVAVEIDEAGTLKTFFNPYYNFGSRVTIMETGLLNAWTALVQIQNGMANIAWQTVWSGYNLTRTSGNLIGT